MHCETFRDNLDDFRRGDLPATEDAAMRAHLAECPACAGELATAEALGRLLREAEPITPDDAYFEDLRVRATRERDRRAASESGRIASIPLPARPPRRWLEMAAAFTVGIGFTMLAGAGLRFLGGADDLRGVRATDHAVRSRNLRDAGADRRSLATAIRAYATDVSIATEGVPAGMVPGRPKGFGDEPMKEEDSVRLAAAGGTNAPKEKFVVADDMGRRSSEPPASEAPQSPQIVPLSMPDVETREEAKRKREPAVAGAPVRGVTNLALEAPKLQLGGTSNMAQNQVAQNREHLDGVLFASPAGRESAEFNWNLKAAKPAASAGVKREETIQDKDKKPGVHASGYSDMYDSTNGLVSRGDIARVKESLGFSAAPKPVVVTGSDKFPAGAQAAPEQRVANGQLAKAKATIVRDEVSGSRRDASESSFARTNGITLLPPTTDLPVNRLLNAEDLALAGKHAEALAAFREIAAGRPASRVTLRAQFRAGEILADRPENRSAARETFEACLKDPLAQFLSPELRTEIEVRISRLR